MVVFKALEDVATMYKACSTAYRKEAALTVLSPAASHNSKMTQSPQTLQVKENHSSHLALGLLPPLTPTWALSQPRCPPVKLHGIDEDEVAFGVELGRPGGQGTRAAPQLAAAQRLQVCVSEQVQGDRLTALWERRRRRSGDAEDIHSHPGTTATLPDTVPGHRVPELPDKEAGGHDADQ